MLLFEKYKKTVVPQLAKEFGFKNAMAAPRIEKVTINIGIGKYLRDEKVLVDIERDLARISGQKPVRTKAKKAIASFKTRQGMDIGFKITLRGKRMWDFLERMVSAALPRTRDFRGIPEKAVDQSGNLSVGIKEHFVFPEASGDDVKTIFGFQVIVTTTAQEREHGLKLFKLLGFPIK
ncbi:MAG: 50S ribosomal protein L5 [bacterium]|nr:50S ribosomal protein L5 [bacterium]